jgi:hypothetical protein
LPDNSSFDFDVSQPASGRRWLEYFLFIYFILNMNI